MRASVAFVALALCGAALASAALPAPEGSMSQDMQQSSAEGVQHAGPEHHQDDLQSNVEEPRHLEASLELRRLANARPHRIPRPKGIPALLGATGLLGHAGFQAFKSFRTIPARIPWVSLGIGGARFDTSNLAIFSLIAGLALFVLGTRRRWRNHQARDQWRLDELLRQDRLRVQHLQAAQKGRK